MVRARPAARPRPGSRPGRPGTARAAAARRASSASEPQVTVQRVRLRRPRSEQGRQLARKIERPPAHWLTLGLLLGALLLLLLVQGITVETTGASGTPPARPPGQAAALKTGAALLTAGPNDTLVPREASVGRRVALTFDDGPDPRWTPAIADALKRLGVPAT